MKKILIIAICSLFLTGCMKAEERSVSPRIFKNDFPAGGPVIKIENETLGVSFELMLSWLKKESHRSKLHQSMEWLQIESNTKIHEIEGLTARQIIEFTNSIKKRKYN